jgi:hypothetical protein
LFLCIRTLYLVLTKCFQTLHNVSFKLLPFLFPSTVVNVRNALAVIRALGKQTQHQAF